ncbi:hypothetical protein ARHIZOSPH14_17800 [Agromyces rhizosphaerae]|uniref:Uncharacterized protein n=1 Tax=Agromyces rhizosphaerae TaxID=88374 RepID=A0A9W6CS85_9MICO|nr:hypothetical protein ARHIZOSPH14_17800 [Agromyces rhizosphaerae]
MRDRRAERAGLRAVDVDVDPLVVLGRAGELVDARLVDGEPLAGAERDGAGGDRLDQRGGGVEGRGHEVGPPAT